MATYFYIAFDNKGRKISGSIEGDDINKVKKSLKEKGIYIINISETNPSNISFFPQRIKEEELAVAIRELATLLNSGIPLDECLTGLISQMKEGKLKQIFKKIQNDIREGKSFSSTLSNYPNYFSEMIVSMVKAGEESGTLDLILIRISEFLEKKIAFKDKIKSILTYPILMLIVAFSGIIFIFSFVIPRITKIFEKISITLPLSTHILIWISNFFKNFGIWCILGVIFFFLLFKKFSRTKKGIRFFDSIKLKIPYLRDIFIKSEIASFTRTLSTLLKGGVEILESLDISHKVVSNPNLRIEIQKIKESLSKGGSLSTSFHNSKTFPYIVTQLVSAGEKSGNLSEMFEKIADIYEGEVTQKSTRAIVFIEPLMILFMGGIVFFIALSILLPILQISQSIK